MLSRPIFSCSLLVALLVSASSTASGQGRNAGPDGSPSGATSSKLLTIRLYIGPNLNLMRDWRDGLETLKEIAESRNLPVTGGNNSGIGGSYGGTVLVNVTETVGVGVAVEFLRDENSLVVEDVLGGFLGPGTANFVTSADAFSRVVQAVVAVHPWSRRRRPFFQLGFGIGSGRVRFRSPGGHAEGEGNGVILSGLVGIDWKVFHVSGGVRLHRFGIDYDEVRDDAPPASRDWFSSEAAVRSFSQGRDVDFTGVFLRIGVAFHLINR